MAFTNPKFSGLTDDQVLQLMRSIATTMNLVSELCRNAADQHGGEAVESTFHALDTIIRGVGAIADHATGGDCVGDFAAWMVGPQFHAEQRGGRA